jgi:hypothetical protein
MLEDLMDMSDLGSQSRSGRPRKTTTRKTSIVFCYRAFPAGMPRKEQMMSQRRINIHYAEHETGPAERLSRKVARVVDFPLLNDDLHEGSIVRLDRNPDRDEGIPRIAEIIASPYSCRSMLRFRDEAESWMLLLVLRLLGAAARVMWGPKDGKPGVMVVSHDDGLDPVLLAEAIGIPQPDEEGEGEDEDDDTDGAERQEDHRRAGTNNNTDRAAEEAGAAAPSAAMSMRRSGQEAIYERTWRNKWLTAQATSITDMIEALREAVAELQEMQAADVVLVDDGGTADDYARLVTDDPVVAAKFGFEEEEPDEEDEDAEEGG